MKKIVDIVARILNVLEHSRKLYRKVRNLDRLEEAERAIQLYKKVLASSNQRYNRLENWVREAANSRKKITGESVEDAINETDRS